MVGRRLGRGLDFFLSSNRAPGAKDAGAEALQQVEVGELAPNPHQPRSPIDDSTLQELASSIQASGVLQPILARRVGEQLQIVAGERRWRAARLAGLERVPVLVREISDDQSAVFGLVENVQREDLNALEKAQGFRRLKELLRCSQEEVAKQVGLDRSTVTNFLRLLELPEAVQAHVSRGTLSMGHARALLGLADAEAQVRLAEETLKRRLSVRDVEARVKELSLGSPDGSKKTKGGGKAKSKGKGRPVWLNEIEENLEESLGTPVTVRYGNKGSQIVIECGSREVFERIYEKLKDL